MENSIDHIITRILSGNSSSEDFLSLSEWLNADEKNKKEFRLLKSYWDAEVSFSHSLMPNVSLDNLRKKIDDQSRQKRLRLIRFIATPIAAAIAFLVLFFATIHLNTREAKVQQFYTYITDKNKSHFTLDDGTKIILNRNSRFTYSDAYGTDQRKVNLEGEAYFEVSKDAAHPFKVEAGAIIVQVLGTHFNVEAYPEDTQVKTTLLEGSVSVSLIGKAEESLILSPNESAIYNKDKKSLTLHTENNASEEIIWRNGTLLFKSIPLQEIVRQLSNAFHTDIRIEDADLQNYRMTATFSDGETLEDILSLLCRNQKFEYTKTNDIITITQKLN